MEMRDLIVKNTQCTRFVVIFLIYEAVSFEISYVEVFLLGESCKLNVPGLLMLAILDLVTWFVDYEIVTLLLRISTTVKTITWI